MTLIEQEIGRGMGVLASQEDFYRRQTKKKLGRLQREIQRLGHVYDNEEARRQIKHIKEYMIRLESEGICVQHYRQEIAKKLREFRRRIRK